MAPEDATVFEELRERFFAGGVETVELMTSYYGPKREVRFGMRVHRNGWDHSIYAKTLTGLFFQVTVYLQEHGW